MVQRSLIRPDQLDSNGAYSFAQLNLDGYSGGDLQDGYLMALVLTDSYEGGTDTIRMDAHTGAINQIGTGQVTFNGNVQANQNVTIEGDLTVKGTTTSIETDQMVVTDPITAVNASGTESLSDWSGISVRDQDGYNRFGWVFDDSLTGGDDGYWAISVNGEYSSDHETDPTRAIAYIGAGDSYGDLSSTEVGDSGASKIGVSPIEGLVGNDVQEVLESIGAGTASLIGTTNNYWTINIDADPATDEDVCLRMSSGDGTSLIDAYMCLITNTSTNDDFFQFQIWDDGVKADTSLNVGTYGDTSDINSCVVLNSGDGSNAYSASLCLDNGNLTITGDTIKLDGDIELGTGPEDCIIFNGVICSDIIPCCDDAYDIGSESSRFNDGYFTNLSAINFTVNNDLIVNDDFYVNGNTIIGSDSDDCVIFNASICSDIIPCCDDAYDIGSESSRFNDGYFTNIDASTGNITTVNATDINSTNISTTNLTTSGTTTLGSGPEDCIIFNGVICSDIIPCCDDAYDIGSDLSRFNDGYFTNLDSVTANITTIDSTTVNATDVNSTNISTTNLTTSGTTTLGSGPEDCIIFNGVICSDIIPCCDDAYDIGSSSSRFNDGYFTNLDVVDLNVTNFTVEDLTVNGDSILGSDSSDTITVNGLIEGYLNPKDDCTYQLGDETHKWLDAYFCLFTPNHYTPTGSVYSLYSHLEGIDNALEDTTVDHPRGIYLITTAEAGTDSLDSSRTSDQGDTVDLSGISDDVFRDNIFIYRNGQLLWNDPTPAVNIGAIQNDVARQTGSLGTLLFSGNLRKASVIQIVDMR